ncbi:hypothetical protein Bca4012_018227 [Brassica carinata]
MGKTTKSVFIIACLFLVISRAAAEIEAGVTGCHVDSGGDIMKLCVQEYPLCNCYCRVVLGALAGGCSGGHITEDLQCICYMCYDKTNSSNPYTL